ncbi:MAG: hypothetical protein JO108_11395 [Acidobacteriaceae bacterium]|nr:hypothetical protein [Acidobacteriaceae bacterium]
MTDENVAATYRERIAVPAAAAPVPQPCVDACASYSFVETRSVPLPPAYNVGVSFSIPAGKQAVIQFVTATVQVPAGEWARLRLYTSIGSSPGNFDLVLTPQGSPGGQSTYVATHSLKLFTDNLLEFNINRDNGTTSGQAVICVGGYLLG